MCCCTCVYIYRWCVYYVMRICVNPKQVMVAIEASVDAVKLNTSLLFIFSVSLFHNESVIRPLIMCEFHGSYEIERASER